MTENRKNHLGISLAKTSTTNKDRLFYLGVDAGASKTETVISDSAGNIIGFSRTGCGNHQVDLSTAELNIHNSVIQALNMANLKKEDISFAFFGLAGADRKSDFAILNPLIKNIGFRNWKIECDTMIALRAGSQSNYGVVLICGTGVNCAGKNRSGSEVQIGGFGYMFGDFGGGQDLAMESVRTVIRTWEGRAPKTELTPVVLDILNYPNVETMRDDLLDRPRPISLDIVPKLLNLAAAEDECSKKILEKQGMELAISANAVIRKLELTSESFDLILAGSILTKEPGTMLFDIIEKEVHQIAPFANIIRLSSPPVIGAILRAMEEDGMPICATVLANLQKYHSGNYADLKEKYDAKR